MKELSIVFNGHRKARKIRAYCDRHGLFTQSLALHGLAARAWFGKFVCMRVRGDDDQIEGFLEWGDKWWPGFKETVRRST